MKDDMTAADIRQERQRLLDREDLIHRAMRDLQAKCGHENLSRSVGFYGTGERSICETCEDCGHVAYSD
jgi:hypothetical protein